MWKGFLLLSLITSIQLFGQDSLITQRIIYKTSRAQKVYLVWSTDNWNKIPDSIYWPEHSFRKEKLIYTPLNGRPDSFYVSIALPRKTYLNYMFWVPIDINGDSTDGWDSYGEIFFSNIFLENQDNHIGDSGLWIPEKPQKPGFSILRSGWIFLSASVLLSTLLLITYRKRLRFNNTCLFAGFLTASAIMIILSRLQLLDYKIAGIPGALFPDIELIFVITILCFPLQLLTRSWKNIQTAITIVFCLILALASLFSLVNIEIVKHLGKPLNYQWLYYSDFLQSADAKNAMAYNISGGLKLNLALLITSVLLFGITAAFIPIYISQKKLLIISIPGIAFTGVSFYQFSTGTYEPGKSANPVSELLISTITAEKKPKLFTMTIDPEIKSAVEKYHTNAASTERDTAIHINNIVLFVLESTPKKYVSIYDSSYNVTPHIAEWIKYGTVYQNMYSHIPSTSNSMATMISGIYPLISYKSVISEYEKNALPSLPSALKKAGWGTSFFSSSDLSFGNMGDYAKKYDFETVDDSKSISCDLKRFTVTNTLLDGIDDRCITTRYFQWMDTVNSEKTFSMLWTNQTHYPYFVNKQSELKYITGNDELNRYLNALKTSDEAFGMLMEGLKKRNMLNNTVVILVADHGEAFGTHHQTEHGTKVYEENVSIPCIIFNPMLCKGRTVSSITGLIDIAPTVAYIAGIPYSPQWQGKNLFEDRDSSRTFFICPYSDFLLGTRNGDWKYIYNATLNKDELYDLKSDPGELNNISKKFPEIVNLEYEMIAAWAQYHNSKLKELKEGK